MSPVRRCAMGACTQGGQGQPFPPGRWFIHTRPGPDASQSSGIVSPSNTAASPSLSDFTVSGDRGLPHRPFLCKAEKVLTLSKQILLRDESCRPVLIVNIYSRVGWLLSCEFQKHSYWKCILLSFSGITLQHQYFDNIWALFF